MNAIPSWCWASGLTLFILAQSCSGSSGAPATAAAAPAPGPGKGGEPDDRGLALISGDRDDDYRFRTPPLRNVELALTDPAARTPVAVPATVPSGLPVAD